MADDCTRVLPPDLRVGDQLWSFHLQAWTRVTAIDKSVRRPLGYLRAITRYLIEVEGEPVERIVAVNARLEVRRAA
jgi:hypothetical protein